MTLESNPYVKNIRVSEETHKSLKIMAVQLDCRVDVLADFVVSQYLKKHDVPDIDQDERFKEMQLESLL